MTWISVKDKLPAHGKRVILHEIVKPEYENCAVVIGWLNETIIREDSTRHEFVNIEWQPAVVDYWMEIPPIDPK